jgi:hypothetical protein
MVPLAGAEQGNRDRDRSLARAGCRRAETGELVRVRGWPAARPVDCSAAVFLLLAIALTRAGLGGGWEDDGALARLVAEALGGALMKRGVILGTGGNAALKRMNKTNQGD